MKKVVNAIPKSPSVPSIDGRISAGGAKHSTGALGRAFPANVDKRVRAKGNPAGVKKK